jgi:hypothetical protein
MRYIPIKMKYWQAAIVCICITLGVSACKNDKTLTHTQKLAHAVCDCTAATKIMELNTLAAQATQAQEGSDQVDRLMESISREHAKMVGCLQPAISTFGGIKKEESDQFEVVIRQVCPRLDSMLIDYAMELITE